MPIATEPCPKCSSTSTRPITTKELRERNGGRDPLVVVMPTICNQCGHVFQRKLSTGTYYLVASLAGVLCVAAMAGFVACFGLIVRFVINRGLNGAQDFARDIIRVGGVGLVCLLIAVGAGAVVRKYMRLARGANLG